MLKKLIFAICILLPAISIGKTSGIATSSFGTLTDGRKVTLYTLTNASGASMQVTDYGARIVSIKVPDATGELTDVIVGPGDLGTFESRDRFMGCIIGRYGNRIDNASFTLDGITYHLDPNENFDGAPVHISGGSDGFDRKLWKVKTLKESRRVGVSMSYFSPDGEMGYPGNLNASVTYWWTDDNICRIEYSATTDKPTIVNLSNHSYFNLGGQDRYVMEERLQVEADEYVQNNRHFCPDKIIPVEDSPFDFREPHRVDYRLDMPNEHLTIMRGMSACWPIRGYDGSLRKACTLKSPATGIGLECWTTEPSLLTYTARGFNGTIPGKYGPLEKYTGMLLETTHFADSPNQPRFPSTVIRPGEKYSSQTEFRFFN